MTRYLLAGFLALIAAPAFANDWEEIDDDKGIKVFSKEPESGSALMAFKGETVLDAPLQKVLWIIVDNSHRKEWVDRLEKSVVLEKVSTFEYYLYQHFGLPWYVTDRDYVYHCKAVRNAKGQVRVNMTSKPHKDSPETVGVRAKLVNSAWILTPQGKGKTKVEVEILTDPKGMIPTWLVNLIQESWPMKTLLGVRGQIDKDYVKDHPLPPIEKKKAKSKS